MKISNKSLPYSRVQYTVELDEVEVDGYFQHALQHLSASVKVQGFRPGKAPAKLVREQLKPGALREEAYSLAVQGAWVEVSKKIEKGPIHDPEVDLAEFAENKPAKVIFEFDVRPEVTIKNWEKITIKGVKKREITDKEVGELIGQLQKAHAKTTITLDPARVGDKVDVTFTGSIKGVVKEKLSSKNFPVVIGEQTVIPGFAEELVGMKKNDQKKFSLTFPRDHFDKELAGQKVDFEARAEEVYRVELPEPNDELGKQFGHDKLEDLKNAIREDLDREAKEEFASQQKAAWLAEFEKCVTTELPKSLIEAEVARARSSWEDFLAKRNLSAKDWLERQKTTLEELEKDWAKAAEASVTIGLGLAKLAAEQKKNLNTNEEYQVFLDMLVAQNVTRK